jgi:hypothetical protein
MVYIINKYIYLFVATATLLKLMATATPLLRLMATVTPLLRLMATTPFFKMSALSFASIFTMLAL